MGKVNNPDLKFTSNYVALAIAWRFVCIAQFYHRLLMINQHQLQL